MIRLSTRPDRAGYSLFALAGLAQLLLARDALGNDPRGVAWRTDLASAQAESRATGLPLWIQFTGPWCVNCRRMERGAFVNPGVVAASRDRFIPVKLRSDEYEQLALNLGLTALPSTVIVRPTGHVIDKWEGLGEPAEFLAFLDESLKAKDGPVEVALASHCPVSLVDRRQLVPGLPTLTARHEGLEYRFRDEAARRAFLDRPERYAPANRGVCPVRQVDGGTFRPGDPRWGVLYRGHLYLCADAAGRARFLADPERYANVDPTSRDRCPHCWGEGVTGRVAQAEGHPAPSTASRRSASPPAVLEAFLGSVTRLRR